MRSLWFALFLIGSPLFAENIWFDPPNPNSRSPVTAHVIGAIGPCGPSPGTTVTRAGNLISINLRFACNVPAPGRVAFDEPVDLGVLPAGVYEVVAGPNNLLVAIASGTLTVADVQPPFRIFPNVGFTTGEKVTIVGQQLQLCFLIDPCLPPVVRFGDVRATDVQVLAVDKLVATAPPHAPGTVDVTIDLQKTLRATAAFHYFSNVTTADRAFFEPVLFPVAINGPGAFGSLWSTELTLRNENDYTLADGTIFNEVCMPVCDTRPPAHSTRRSFETLSSGFVMHVPASGRAAALLRRAGERPLPSGRSPWDRDSQWCGRTTSSIVRSRFSTCPLIAGTVWRCAYIEMTRDLRSLFESGHSRERRHTSMSF